MAIVRASPFLPWLCRRLDGVIDELAKYWRSDLSPLLPSWKLALKSNPHILYILSNNIYAHFLTLFFAIYDDYMRLFSVMAALWQVCATALFCANDSIDTTTAVGSVTGPQGHPPCQRLVGSGPRPRARKDEWSGLGERPTPDTPHPARGAPPGHPHAAPTAHKASSQERALWGW